MKKKLFKLRLPYFFGQRNPGTAAMPQLIKTETGLQRTGMRTEDLLRWSDDGGNLWDAENGTTGEVDFDAEEEESHTVESQRKTSNDASHEA